MILIKRKIFFHSDVSCFQFTVIGAYYTGILSPPETNLKNSSDQHGLALAFAFLLVLMSDANTLKAALLCLFVLIIISWFIVCSISFDQPTGTFQLKNCNPNIPMPPPLQTYFGYGNATAPAPAWFYGIILYT